MVPHRQRFLITPDADIYPQVRATETTEGYLSNLCYTDFTLTFVPFDTIPETFDFIEGDVQGAFVIRNISVK